MQLRCNLGIELFVLTILDVFLKLFQLFHCFLKRFAIQGLNLLEKLISLALIRPQFFRLLLKKLAPIFLPGLSRIGDLYPVLLLDEKLELLDV